MQSSLRRHPPQFKTRVLVAFAWVAFAGCSGEPSAADGGAADVGTLSDAGEADAGQADAEPRADAGEVDAGSAPDGGPVDASEVDAGAADTGSAPDAGEVDAGGSECTNLPAGPITPTLVSSAFNGSEDLAFDGMGGLVAKNGSEVVRIDSSGAQTTLATAIPQAYGLRYGAAGDLFVALPSAGKVIKITAGVASDFAVGLSGPNGVYGDFDGNVWVTEFSGGRIVKLDATAASTPIAQGLNSPNGIVLDVVRNTLFFTSYSQGRLLRVDPAGGTPTEVGQISGAALDGLVLDACGNIYAVDQGNDRLYRFNLDSSGALIGQPELIAQFPANIANAQFGAGPGWNATSLYAAGNPGRVYEIPVGITGAPVPAAQ